MATHWTEKEWRCPTDDAFHVLDLSKGNSDTDLLPCIKCGNLCTPGLVEDGMANTTVEPPKVDAHTERKQWVVEIKRLVDAIREHGAENPSLFVPPIRERLIETTELAAEHAKAFRDALDRTTETMTTAYDVMMNGSALAAMGLKDPVVGAYLYHEGQPVGAVLRYDFAKDEATVHFFAQPPHTAYSLESRVLTEDDEDPTVPTNLRVPGDFELTEQFCVRMTLEDGDTEDDTKTQGDLRIAEQRVRQLMYGRPDVVSCEIVKVWKRVES